MLIGREEKFQDPPVCGGGKKKKKEGVLEKKKRPCPWGDERDGSKGEPAREKGTKETVPPGSRNPSPGGKKRAIKGNVPRPLNAKTPFFPTRQNLEEGKVWRSHFSSAETHPL